MGANKTYSIILSVILFSQLKCQSSYLPDEQLKVYNEILDQVIIENYYHYCFIQSDSIEKIHLNYISGKSDSKTYSRIDDSLKEVRKNVHPKCVLNYYNKLGFINHGLGLDKTMLASLKYALKNDFVYDYFLNVPVQLIIDSISSPARLRASDLKIDYLQISPYVLDNNIRFGDDMGVFGFSKLYFNKRRDKAILFYEFNCGPKCGAGEVVFVDKVNGKWKIISCKRIWDS